MLIFQFETIAISNLSLTTFREDLPKVKFETIAISNLSLTIMLSSDLIKMFETIAISNLSLTSPFFTHTHTHCLRLLLFLT